MKLKIDNFIGLEKARDTLKQIEEFDTFSMFVRDYTSILELDKLDDTLNNISNRIREAVKEFKNKQLTFQK